MSFFAIPHMPYPGLPVPNGCRIPEHSLRGFLPHTHRGPDDAPPPRGSQVGPASPEPRFRPQRPSREASPASVPAAALGSGSGVPGWVWGVLVGVPAPRALSRGLSAHSRTQRFPSSWSWNSGRHWQQCWVTVSWTHSCWQPPLPTAQEVMAGDTDRSCARSSGRRPSQGAYPRRARRTSRRNRPGLSAPLFLSISVPEAGL